MSEIIYYDRDGQPLSSREWADKHSKLTYKVVKQEVVEGKFVSTVWLGLDHGFGFNGRPLIFETMIFPADDDGTITDWAEEYCERYSTEEEARAGHEIALALVREKART